MAGSGTIKMETGVALITAMTAKIDSGFGRRFPLADGIENDATLQRQSGGGVVIY